MDYARRVNPKIKILQVSATSGEGMDGWYQWIRATRLALIAGMPKLQRSA